MIDIIIRPVFTIKTTYIVEKFNRYVFEVERKISKPQIRFIIEKVFSVSVYSVNTYRQTYKKRFSKGKKSIKVKRAFISLDDSQNIVFF
jgi:large subunit ribosomal protein L23